METRKRSMAKTLSFRLIATITTMILIFLFTGNLLLAGVIGVLEFILKIIIFYFHERAWNKTTWGEN